MKSAQLPAPKIDDAEVLAALDGFTDEMARLLCEYYLRREIESSLNTPERETKR